MARRPKPWFRKERQAWFVTINGAQHNLGSDKNQAYDRFHELMRQPTQRRVSSQLMVAIIDEFLDWCSRNRAVPTYEWYRYRLERFAQMYPSLRIADLRPFHVELCVDSAVGERDLLGLWRKTCQLISCVWQRNLCACESVARSSVSAPE